MSGFTCRYCGGEMQEDLMTGDATCDCCGLVIRYDGTEDYSAWDDEMLEELILGLADRIVNFPL